VSVSTPEYTPVIERPAAPPVPELPPFIGNGRPRKLPRRRLGKHASATFALVLLVTIGAGALRFADGLEPVRPIVVEPTVVYATITFDPVVVRGAPAEVRRSAGAKGERRRAKLGEPVDVALTAYCLKGLTRRDHYVRQGIVAADPKVFPLGRYVEIYVGAEYYGRFLVDDTGRAIKGNILDIWTPTCREARVFGRTKGTAVLVPKPRGASADTLLTGRLGGAARPGTTEPDLQSRR
jgi:3D (Asp-Asp-Asp) domain-containing protein